MKEKGNRVHTLIAQMLLKAFDGFISIPPNPQETARNILAVVDVVEEGMRGHDLDTAWIRRVYALLLDASTSESEPLAYMALGAAKDRVSEVAERGWDA